MGVRFAPSKFVSHLPKRGELIELPSQIHLKIATNHKDFP